MKLECIFLTTVQPPNSAAVGLVGEWLSPKLGFSTTVARSSARFSKRCFSIVPRYINSIECVVSSVYTGISI